MLRHMTACVASFSWLYEPLSRDTIHERLFESIQSKRGKIRITLNVESLRSLNSRVRSTLCRACSLLRHTHRLGFSGLEVRSVPGPSYKTTCAAKPTTSSIELQAKCNEGPIDFSSQLELNFVGSASTGLTSP